MGVGGVIYAGAALLGLQVLFAAVPWLYALFKVIAVPILFIWGGGSGVALRGHGDHRYSHGPARRLARAAARIEHAACQSQNGARVHKRLRGAVAAGHFLVGSVCVVARGGSDRKRLVRAVALALSASGPRASYLRYKVRIDRVAGGVLAALGIKLVIARSA